MIDDNIATPVGTKAPFLSGRMYDFFKFIAQIALPGAGTLYFTLSQTWGFAKGEEVLGTITSVDVFLGLLLGLSSMAYNKSGAKYDGSIDVQTNEDQSKMFSLVLSSDPMELEQKDEVTFKVNPS